ncbi:uncharacterized protein BO66DRAFT_430197 [Aspergillus aculeatinus CBS 121060]|uniref:Uncharacterized protein n=1 Tax=Aspergillus aculeatinus CBS 121060 TaxID=1448322 RepID=A0ACD1H316_9EURO|nr:hypothetical protein BO66DRAFT_430197 [Aspergillus aculeatinus CBS 121060]RAH68162.1 hypothetical protein BO66DRAFT_430197 [Aspergillus aculeatinus CBS 121060]
MFASRSGTIKRAIEQARENADPCTDPVLIEIDLVVVPAAGRKYGRLELEAVAGVPQRPQPADLLSPKLCKIWANMVKSLDDQVPYLKPEYPASQRLAIRADQGEEPDDILHHTKALMTLGEELEATKAVFSALDEAFVGMGDGLGEAVAEDPVQWLCISMTLRDSWIFKDAACHVVGKWHNLEHEVKMSIPEAARRVCQSHSDKLVQRCQDVEDYMMNIEFAPSDDPGPSDLLGLSPHMWVALTRFREWVYKNISEGNGFRGAEGGFILYRYLCEEEDDDNDEYDNQWAPYLDEDDCPKEDADEVNAGLLCLRELCVDKLEPLLESNVSDSSVRYLTCAEIDNEDVPWDDEDDDEDDDNDDDEDDE